MLKILFPEILTLEIHIPMLNSLIDQLKKVRVSKTTVKIGILAKLSHFLLENRLKELTTCLGVLSTKETKVSDSKEGRILKELILVSGGRELNTAIKYSTVHLERKRGL